MIYPHTYKQEIYSTYVEICFEDCVLRLKGIQLTSSSLQSLRTTYSLSTYPNISLSHSLPLSPSLYISLPLITTSYYFSFTPSLSLSLSTIPIRSLPIYVSFVPPLPLHSHLLPKTDVIVLHNLQQQTIYAHIFVTQTYKHLYIYICIYDSK